MSVRKIQTGDKPLVVPDPGDTPTLQWVEIDKLVLDDTYQRPLLQKNWKHIVGIAAKFCWQRFSALVVAERGDGTYAIIDGQHRTHAAKLCGIKQVPALVHSMDLAEQASAFSSINGNVQAMTNFHVYRAALAAREKWAVDADELVRSAGCQLMTSNKSAQAKKPGELFCIKMIDTMIQQGESEVVALGLRALKRSQVGVNTVMYGAQYLKPFLMAIASNAQFLKLDLADFLNTVDVESIIDRAGPKAKYSDRSKGSIATEDIKSALRHYRSDEIHAAE